MWPDLEIAHIGKKVGDQRVGAFCAPENLPKWMCRGPNKENHRKELGNVNKTRKLILTNWKVCSSQALCAVRSFG